MGYRGFVFPRWLLLSAAPWPALLLGAWLMRGNGVPAAQWGQNLAAGLALWVICVGGRTVRWPLVRAAWWVVPAVLSVVLLQATFLDPGDSSVHRWVQAGAVRMYAAAVCLPVLVIALGRLLQPPAGNTSRAFVRAISLAAVVLLARQPDAAQATAFGGALLVLLCFYRRPAWPVVLTVLIVAACVAWTWTRPDPLEPVIHVEKIVGVAGQRGALWLLAALASLALLPWPFLLARDPEGGPSPENLALATYFWLEMLAPAFGAFPVPLLGYGLSPILGYFLALGWSLGGRRDS